MKIGIVCNDTRGGVEPYLALALALRTAQQDVRVVAPAGLSTMFVEHDFPTTALPPVEEGLRVSAAGIAEQGTLATMRLMRRELPMRLERATRVTLTACDGCDLMTGGIGGMVTGLVAAEVLGVRWIPTHLQPLGRPTARYRGTLVCLPRWFGAPGRLLSHPLSDAAAWLPFQSAMTTVRRALGVTERRDPAKGMPILYGFSRHVVPLPQDDHHVVTGYWQLRQSDTAELSADLSAFLDRPGLVVGIGFGSMGSADPEALGTLVVAAARRAGARVVLLGDGLRAEDTDDVMTARDVPHGRIFRRLDAVVHHGGAGTTGTAFTAGTPQVVVPFAVDQPFWGSRVSTLGCGPRNLRRKNLTETRLAALLQETLVDQRFKRNAVAVAALIAADDGTRSAAEAMLACQRH